MTRETKLGLGVGVSFLSLVAVVCYNALTKTEETPLPEVAKVVLGNGGPPEKEKEKKGALSHDSGIKTVGLTESPKQLEVQKQSEQASKSHNGLNPGSELKPFQATPTNNSLPVGFPPAAEAPAPPQLNNNPYGPIPPAGVQNPNLQMPASAKQQPPIPEVGPVKPPDLNAGSFPELPLPGQPQPPKSMIPEPPPPFGSGGVLPGHGANKVPDPALPLQPSVANNLAKEKKDHLNVEPQLPGSMLPQGGGGLQIPPVQPAPLPGEIPTSPPGDPFQKGGDAGSKLSQAKNPGVVPLPDGTAKAEAPLPQFGPPGPPTQPLPLNVGPLAPPAGFGNETPKPAPFVAGANPNKPQVKSYDEGLHITKPGENDFAAVSKTVYGSDKYATALKDYNREFLAQQGGTAGSQLQPGTKVLYPPISLLEGSSPKYPPGQGVTQPMPMPPVQPLGQTFEPLAPAPSNAVPVVPVTPQPKPIVTPLPPSTGSPVPPPSKINNPPPFQPVQQGTQPQQPGVPPVAPPPTNFGQPPAAANPNVPPSGGQFKMYTVPQGGMRFYEIARDTLGNAGRWSEIYSLNTQIDPLFAVPAGTQLKLPADARIGQ